MRYVIIHKQIRIVHNSRRQQKFTTKFQALTNRKVHELGAGHGGDDGRVFQRSAADEYAEEAA